MLPLRDVIPSRTTPWITLLLMAAAAGTFLAAAVLPSGRQPASLHPTWLHLVVDVGALWLFGENVEDRLGHGRFLALVLAMASVSGMADVWTTPDAAGRVLGAAGPVAGVIGAYLTLFPRSRVLVLLPSIPTDLVEVPAAALAVGWVLVQVAGALGGAAGRPSFVTLATGMAAGVLGALILRRPERSRVEWWGP